MKIWTMALGAVCAVGLGCATSASDRAGDAQYESYNHSAVMGVIALPEGAAARTANPCAGIQVMAMTTDRQVQVGRAVVRETRNNRCAYEIDKLPSDVQLSIHVKPNQAWTCENGQPVSLTPDARPVKLQSYETRTQDFQAQCSRPQAS